MGNSLRVSVRIAHVLIVAFAGFWVTAACATFGHHRDPDRVRLLSAVDSPDPFTPPGQRSVLKVSSAVRKFSGIGNHDDTDEDDCDDDRHGRRSHSKVFELTVQWKISRGRQTIRVLEKSIEVRPPYQFANLPRDSKGRDTRTFAIIPVELTWDGRLTNGELAAPGSYSWEAEALLTRVHTHHGRTKEKYIDESNEIEGTLTISSAVPPPTVTISQPQAGLLTRASTLVVTGAVTGQAPLTVNLNGTPATVGQGSYAGSVSLVEGANTLVATVTDAIGRTSTATVSVTKDGVAPGAQLTAPTTTVSTSSPRISFSFADSGSGVDPATARIVINGIDRTAQFVVTAGGAEINTASPLTLPDGSTTVTASIRDVAGNEGTAAGSFTVDTTAPLLSIAPPTGSVTSTRAPAIALNYADAGTGVSVDTLRINIQDFDRTSLFDIFANHAQLKPGASLDLQDGSVTVNATLADSAGNVASNSSSFLVDATPPQVSIAVPAQGAILNTGNPAVEVSFTDSGSGIDAESVRILISGVDRSSAFDISSSGAVRRSTEDLNVPDGPASASVTVRDRAGNTTTTTHSFVVDTGGPVVTIATPAEGAFTNQRTPPIAVEYSDGGSGLTTSSLVIRVDNLEVTSAFDIAPAQATLRAGSNLDLSDGVHTLSASIRDQAGNQAQTTRTFTVDTVSPTVALSAPQGPYTTSPSPAVAFTFSDTSAGIDADSTRILVNGVDRTASFTTSQAGAVLAPGVALGLPDGGTTVEAHIRDRAGNAGSLSASFVVDTAPPSLAVSAPAEASYVKSSNPEIHILFSDSGSGIATDTARILISGTDRSTDFEVSQTGASVRAGVQLNLAEGAGSVHAEVRDRAGHTTTAQSSFIVDTIAPQLTVLSPAPGFVTGMSPIRVTGQIVDASPISKLRVNGIAATVTSGAFSVDVPLQEGPVTLSFCLSDEAGNATARVVHGTYDAHPPILSITQPAEGALFKMDPIAVSGAVFDQTAVSVTVNGVSASVQGSSYSAQVPLVQGSNTLEVVATDASGLTTSASRTVTLDLEKPSITIVTPANGSTQTTAAMEVLVTYHNGLSGILPGSFHATLDGQDRTAEFTASTSEARLILTPSNGLTAGQHTLSCTVADRAGHDNSATSSFTITLGPLPPLETPTSGFAIGSVLDGGTNSPLAGVEVTVQGIPGTKLSRADGSYEFPTLNTGEYVITLEKPGYTSVQRRVKIVKGRETAVKPALLLQRSPPVHIDAALGGVVTDPTGRIEATIPPGALSASADIQLTELPGSKFLPGELPPQSMYLAAFNFEPSMTFNAPVHIKYKLRTTVAMPINTRIPVGWYDPTAAKWVHDTYAFIKGDGRTLETDIAHSSSWDLNPPGFIPPGPIIPSNVENKPTATSGPYEPDIPDVPGPGPYRIPLTVCEGCPPRCIVDPNSGDVQTSIGTGSPPYLIYKSLTVDPGPMLDTAVFRDTRASTPAVDSTSVEIYAGRLYKPMFFAPSFGSSQMRYAWDGRDRHGAVLQSGSYEVRAQVSHNYSGLNYGLAPVFGGGATGMITGPRTIEPVPVSNNVGGRVRIVNRSKSAIGAGWGVAEVGRLHFDPDGPIMVENGNGSSSTFQPTQILFSTFVDNTNQSYGFLTIDTASNRELNRTSFPENLQNPRRAMSITLSADRSKAYVSRGRTISLLGAPSYAPLDLAQMPGLASLKLVIAALPDGNRIFVASGEESFNSAGVAFSLFDVNTKQFTTIHPLDSSLHFTIPQNAVVSPDGRYGYAILASAQNVAFPTFLVRVDLSTGATTTLPFTFAQKVQGNTVRFALSPDGQMGAVSGLESTYLVSMPDMAVTGSIAGNTREVLFTGDNKKLLATTAFGVFIYDLASSSGLTVAIGAFPNGLALSSDNRTLFLSGPLFRQQSDQPFDFNFNSYSVLTTIDVEDYNVRVPAPSLRIGFGGSLAAVMGGDVNRYTAGAGDFSTLTRNPSDNSYSRLFPDGRIVTYDATGRQRRRIERDGRSRNYSYDASDRIAAITYPEAETVTFTYGSGGLESIRNRYGRILNFHSVGGRLVSVTDPAGGVRSFSYDTLGRLEKEIDESGSEMSVVYGDFGKVTQLLHGNHSVTIQPEVLSGLINMLPSGQGTPSSPAPRIDPSAVRGQYTTLDGGTELVRSNAFGQFTEQTNGIGGAIKNTYDKNGLVTATSDELNRTTTYLYDSTGNLTQTTLPDGSKSRSDLVTIGVATVPVRRTTPRGGVTSIAYDSTARVVATTNPVGGSTRFTYGPTGLPNQVVSPSERTVRIDRNAFGDPTLITLTPTTGSGDAATWAYGYDNFRNQTSLTDPEGRTSTSTFDGKGRKLSTTDPEGNSEHWEYDNAGRVTKHLDANGNPTVSTWSDEGERTSVTNALNQTTHFTYTPNRRPTSKTNFRGESFAMTYDAIGRQLTSTDPLGRLTVYSWSGTGKLLSKSEPGGRVTTYAYDSRDRMLTERYPDGSVQSYSYYSDDPVLSITDPSARSITYERDLAGRATAIVDPTGAKERIEYDADGRVSARVDRLSHRTEFAYNQDGQPESITFPGGDVHRTTYNRLGLLTRVTTARGGAWAFEYDAAQRLVRKTDPLGHTTEFGYDPTGNLVRVDEPGENGSRVVRTMTYDALNRLLSLVTPDRSLSYTYLDSQRLVRVQIAPSGLLIERAYDEAGRQIRETVSGDGPSRVVEFKWSVSDTVEEVTQNGQLVQVLSYDGMRRLTKIRDPRSNREHGFRYSPSGEVVEISYPSGLKRNQVWGSRGELQSLEYHTASGAALLLRQFTYDAAMRLTFVADEQGTLVAYAYDDRDRLVRADYRGGEFESWTYDPNSNISAYATGAVEESRVHDLADQLKSIESTHSLTGATSSVSIDFEYDDRGNTLRRRRGADVREFLWSSEGRLLRVTDNGQQKFAARYLDDYRLSSIESNTGSTEFSWFGQNVLSEFSSGVESGFFIGMLGLDQPLESGGPGHVRKTSVTDHLHSVIGLFDENQGFTEFTTFSAFGVRKLGNSPKPIQFAGARSEGLTGYSWLRNRWYDPEEARFLSRDPSGFGGGLNLYSYAANNPASARDPMGLLPTPWDMGFLGYDIARFASDPADAAKWVAFDIAIILFDPSGSGGGLARGLQFARVAHGTVEAARFGRAARTAIDAARATHVGVTTAADLYRLSRSTRGDCPAPPIRDTGRRPVYHGDVPPEVPNQWDLGDLELAREELEASLDFRKTENDRLGWDPGHTRRYLEEEAFLAKVLRRIRQLAGQQ